MKTERVLRVLPVSRRAVMFALLKGAVVAVAASLLPTRRSTQPGIVLVVVIPILLYFLWPILRAFGTGIAVEITERGITSCVGSVTFVAWEEIQDARAGSLW